MKLSRSELQLETIVSRIVNGELDLQPDFQRGEIWDKPRRQRLIDSILREWYVPAVHIVQDENGTEVVLDGQQRLAAIRDFFDDGFAVNGSTEPRSDFIQALNGLKFSRLPSNVQRSVRRFVLQVITLTDFEPQEPNELFFRLNQSYNLTPPEKRNALHGPARDRIKMLVNDLQQVGLLTRESIGFANGRLAYDDVIARTCVALENNDLRLHINNNVVEEFYRAGNFDDATLTRVQSSGVQLMHQIEKCSDRVRLNKGSLFTWLVYLDWAPRVAKHVPTHLLASFETDRAASKAGKYEGDDILRRRVLDCVTLYENRVSYRVTDVSSVLIRDLVLHLYTCLVFDGQPVRNSEILLDRMLASPRPSLQVLVDGFLQESDWGISLTSRIG